MLARLARGIDEMIIATISCGCLHFDSELWMYMKYTFPWTIIADLYDRRQFSVFLLTHSCYMSFFYCITWCIMNTFWVEFLNKTDHFQFALGMLWDLFYWDMMAWNVFWIFYLSGGSFARHRGTVGSIIKCSVNITPVQCAHGMPATQVWSLFQYKMVMSPG